jgi:hypothetical protein
MGDVINLRRARTARQRAESAQAATEARALHGLTKSARTTIEADQSRLARRVEQSRRETDVPAEGVGQADETNGTAET